MEVWQSGDVTEAQVTLLWPSGHLYFGVFLPLKCLIDSLWDSDQTGWPNAVMIISILIMIGKQ